MSADRPSSDAGLVEALSGRLERLELYVARELVDWVEGATLSFAEMRVFLAMADGRPRSGADLAEAAGLSVDLTYPALHSLTVRGWLSEANRSHCLTALGKEKADSLSATRHAAVESFIASLPADERQDLAVGLASVRP